MSDIKGDRLFVNVGASQARKRLKGFGHGVRKVQSVGKNQAVIIHTATGQHLRELESLFADATPARSSDNLGIPVENLRNLGATSAQWLKEINVHTKEDLEQLGPAVAYRMVKRRQPGATANLLWALAGALADVDWRELSEHEKQKLLSETSED